MKFVLMMVGLVMVGCADSAADRELESLRTRADLFLQHIRSEQWDKAAGFVVVDAVTQQRMSIPDDASPESRSRLVANWLEELYRNIKPGPVYSVALDPGDADLALVTYRAGDLDAFNMRLIDGQWMYTLDWKPHD